MSVSVVIPARNAAQTLPETLTSLIEQQYDRWEAVVVDDGSTDHTREVVERFRERDSRIRLVGQENRGPAEARNRGVADTTHDHLLFLDADDWILPDHLSKLMGALQRDPGLDAVVCGWSHVTPDGEHVFRQRPGERGDLFRPHAQYCYSLIHTYLLRRSVVESVGGFDSSFRTCEDWDMFQRIARSGARFGQVPEVLAAYRMRTGSATSDGMRLLQDGFRVLRTGHGPDPRVEAHPVHPDGLPLSELPPLLWGHGCTCAGYLLGSGGSALPVLSFLKDAPSCRMKPGEVAETVFVHTMVAAARPVAQWPDVWRDSKEQRKEFLAALEDRLNQKRLQVSVEVLSAHMLRKYSGNPRKRPALAELGTSDSARRLHQLLKVARLSVRSTVRAFQPAERIWLAGKRLKDRIRHHQDHQGAADFEALFRADSDPWDVNNAYEAVKAEQAMDFLPAEMPLRALEIGCAEGHLTKLLARRVSHLVAADVSETALARAAIACRELTNVEFCQTDCFTAPPAGPFDLIVCSEVLYYCSDRRQLRRLAHALFRHLQPGGHLLLVHANHVFDDPKSCGFAWSQPFGSRVIRETFADVPGLSLIRDGRAPLYGIQLFRKGPSASASDGLPEILPMAEPLPPHVASQAYCGISERLPILIYRNVGASGQTVSCAQFDDHLSVFDQAGFHGIRLNEWRSARDYRAPIAGRIFHLILEGHVAEHTPRLQHAIKSHGLSVTYLLHVDGDRILLPEGAEREQWHSIRELQKVGVQFGLALHSPADAGEHSFTEQIESLRTARQRLEQELDQSVTLLHLPSERYPNPAMRWALGAAGFSYASCSRQGVASWRDSLFELPTVTVTSETSSAELLGLVGAMQA